LQERGLGAHAKPKKKTKDDREEDSGDQQNDTLPPETVDVEFENGYEVYEISWIPSRIQRSCIARYIKIFPGQSPTESITQAPLMAM
jgi:hypothetical protein